MRFIVYKAWSRVCWKSLANLFGLPRSVSPTGNVTPCSGSQKKEGTMSIYSSGRKKKKNIRSLYGHLKLFAYEESSALVVRILEARGLPKKDSGTAPESYVKLYILPDPHKLTKQKTRMNKSKDPKFEESFTWILTPEDQEKRLNVSLWTKEKAKHVIVGCMSFEMTDILGPDKCIKGWYQLLDEERGLTENVPIATTITSKAQIEPDSSSSSKKIAVTLKRGSQGYGFSVTGFNPIYITRVQPDLPAAESGLKVNDIIVEVEGIDVTKASGQVVVEMIRKNPNDISLLIKRCPTMQLTRQSMSQYEIASLTQPASEPYGRPVSLSSHHSTLNLATGRDSASKRRNLFHNQASKISLSPEHSQDDLLESSQPNLRTSKGSLLASPHDMSGSDRSLKDSPRKHPSITRLSSGSSQGSGLQVPAIASLAYTSSNTPPAELPRHNSSPQTEGMGPTGSTAGFYTLQRHHRRSSSYRDEQQEQPHRLAHAARRLSTDNVLNLPESDEVFASVRSRNRSSPQAGRSGSSSSSGFNIASSHLRRTSMSQISGSGYNQVQSQSTYDAAYSSQRKHSPLNPPRHFSATQAHEPAYSISSSRDRIKSVALSPPGNVQLTAARRVFSDERLGPGSSYGRKLSDNDSALGGSVGDFAPIPLQVGGLSPKQVTVDYETLDKRERKRQIAIHDLLSTEYDFEMRMQSGIETFLDPLKSKMQGHNHRMIFMNLEEIFELTQDICNVLRSRRQDYTLTDPQLPYFVPSFADIYKARLRPLKHQYEKYFKLFEQVGLELSVAFRREDFSKYVKQLMERSSVHQDLYEFVLLPKMHLPKLLFKMMLVSSLTSAKQEDPKHLVNVIDSLISCCPDQELVSKHRKSKDTMTSLKLRVGFSHQIEKIVIDAPGRSLVFEGEVTVVEKKWKRNKRAWLLLFNDILLISLRDGSIYSVIEAPFVLHKTAVQELGTQEGTDFQVSQDSVAKLIRCSSHVTREQWISKFEENTCTVSRASKIPKDVARARRLTGTVDLAEATSLMRNFDSGTVPGAKEGEGERKTKAGDKKKRQGLFGIGRQPSAQVVDKVEQSSSQNGVHPHNPFLSIPGRTLKVWAKSFDALLESAEGKRLFGEFLRKEVSQENLQFWWSCEQFKQGRSDHDNLVAHAQKIYDEFVKDCSAQQVNLDHKTLTVIEENMKDPSHSTFDTAQHIIYQLMARDSYPRFLKTPDFQEALKLASEIL